MFNLDKYGNNISVITDAGDSLTYLELRQKTSVSVPRGLVFCLAHNNLDTFLAYVTCLQSGLPIVMLDGSKPKEVIDALIEVYRPEYIWDGGLKETGLKGEEINPELAMCLTTSGSTGSPKFVRLTAKNILANAESIAEYLEIDENERPITTLPMYYSYGLSVINSHLLKGATILLTDHTYAQREFWNFLKDQRATSIAGVPYTYEVLRRLRFFRMDLPYLKVMTQAGGKLNKDIAKEYIDYAAANGKKFFVMYGQTEATARMSYLPAEKSLEKYGSMGIAIPRGKLSLIDVDGKIITEPETVGELFQNKFIGRNAEVVAMMLGDAKGRIIFFDIIAQGSVNSTEMPIRKMVDLAIRHNAKTAYIAHNHPSGSLLPSKQDLDTTMTIYDTLYNVGVKLQDHFIVTETKYLSLKDSGMADHIFLY